MDQIKNTNDRILFVWLAISFSLLFGGLLVFNSHNAYLNVVDAFFFLPAFIYTIYKGRTRLKPILVANAGLLIFLIFTSFSTFYAEHPNPSRFFRTFFQILTLFLFFQEILEKKPRAFWNAMITGVLFAAIAAGIDIFCYYFIVDRPFTSQLYGDFETFHINRFIILDTNQLYASMCFVTLPFFSFLAASRLPKSWFTIIIPYVSTAVILLYLLANQRRSTMVALVIGCVLLALMKRKAKFWIPLLISATLIGAIFIANPSIITKRGTSNRIVLWETTWNLIEKAPVLGYGMANKTKPIPIIRPDNHKAEVYDHPHNYFLSLIYYTGLIGFLLWLAVWVPSAFRSLLDKNGVVIPLVALATGFAAILFDGIHPYMPYMYNWPSSWVPMALLISFYGYGRKQLLSKQRL